MSLDDPSVCPRRSARLTVQGGNFEAQVHARGAVYVGPCAGNWLSELRRWLARDGYDLTGASLEP